MTIKTPTYSKDDVALTADSVTAVVELNATSSTAIREGLDLVTVLDVSGSMSGAKLQSMKMAMHFVIMKLTPVDRLSIVAFSNSATRHCPLRSITQAAQNDLKAIVDGLVAGGGTNIEVGMDTAKSVIADRVTIKARTANVFLMSDGQQNNNTDATRPDLGKVSVYTFGFGQDADHALLDAVAKKSPGGTFSSVPDGGNVSAPFSQLLGGLLTVVAQDVQLTLTPKTDEPDLDTMFVAPGTDYTQTTDDDTGVITIKFGTLFSGETRKVAVNLTLLDTDTTDDYDAPLAEAQHSYTAQQGVQNQTPQDILIYRTPNPSQAPTSSKARAVLAEMARRQHAESIGEARVLADAKNLDDARYKLADAQNALEDILLDDGQKLVGMLRAELLQLLEFMESQEVYEAKGRPYALASETSHGRQRYAARGGDMDAVRLFATPRMDTYLEQAKQFEKNPTAPLPSADDDVKQEIAANPLAAISAPLAFYIKAAIQALQEIEKLVAPATN